jgi:tetratricopeptide (TPR) repeat protein
MAADDSEIAQHQCNLVLDDSTPLSSRGDRRWLARKKIAWMTFLEGRTQTALEMYREAMTLTEREEVSLKLEAQLRTLFELDALLILTGQSEELPLHPVFSMQPPAGECPAFDMYKDLNRSLQAAMKQDWAAAAEPLLVWDRLIQDRNGTHLWFEVRLRLIAIKLLAGEKRQADRLAEQLQQRASVANDWLTLRRLTALQDPDLPISLLAPYAREIMEAPTTSDGVSTFAYIQPEEAVENEAIVTPHRQRLLEIGAMFEALSEETVSEDLARIREAVRSVDTNSVDHDTDACALLHMMGYAVGEGEDAAEVWAWANQLAKNFQENPAVLSMLGDLGNRLRFGPNEEFGATITSDRLEPLFRKAIQLKDAKSGTFMRAGDHFMAEQNLGEAERCYARSFRLKRNLGEVAIKLASLYRETDRLRDALHVLDLCLREGADIPQVAWEAGLTAFTLKRYEIMLTYLDRYKAAVGDQLWIDYYRATGLLECGEPAAALEAINHEQELVGEPALHLSIIRGCAYAALSKVAAAQQEFLSALATPLSSVDYLSAPGITSLLMRALNACQNDLADKKLTTQFEDRLLESYLAPEEFFQTFRAEEPESNVTFYQVMVRQPLDENWMSFAGRLPDEEDSDSYLGSWGVLAEDEDAAQRLVLQWQSRCYPLEAEIFEISGNDESFNDLPGIVWQGQRIFPGEESNDDFDGNDNAIDDFDDDEDLNEFEKD